MAFFLFLFLFLSCVCVRVRVRVGVCVARRRDVLLLLQGGLTGPGVLYSSIRKLLECMLKQLR